MPGDATERQAKHAAVLQLMDANELDAVILTRRANYAWYTGGRLNHVPTNTELGVCSLIVMREQAVCLANSIEAPRQINEELEDLGIEVQSFPWHDNDAARHCWLKLLAGKRSACDTSAPDMPAGVQPLPAEFARLRWTLTEPEIDRYRILGREVAECLETTCKTVRPQMTEHQVAAIISKRLLERGIRPTVLLVAADERVRDYRHPIPTNKTFANYGMAVCGGERDGLIVSNSRLFSFSAISDDLRRRHAAVCTVDAAMIDATRPGRTLGDVMRVAQTCYAAMGYADEWTHHHQGGSTGYMGREVKAAPGETTQVLANQAFAWNPTIAGTKSEDTILVAPECNEILSITDDWPRITSAGLDRCWDRCDILNLKWV